ncbi:MAG TPA: glutamyl-tRNA reductase [Polyangiaceae bacterium]|jgi:glutamyl-tRNA reductase|nr:MAG: Glutamyl-tRNA reductase [Deltaproteobacteria bacterium ADurb.Bin207]HNS96832.1 glutamyl-tRNA reductase [Polyangiaceae bacterium]HNZ21565.1 glutamyl-tRNA reductase [Polyangiaceae bacterium]HOD21705.1 glutamyl-tRNA reductase [Polyangiaceae bacterium]HOE48136.1 glutamyl-tRNA reductase [Polyangiaceae bacterium]
MIVVVGASHKTAPIGVRERIAISADRLPTLLSSLHELPEIAEICIVSTCNRVEIYAATGRHEDDAAQQTIATIEQALAEQAGPKLGDVLHQYLFHYIGDAAVRHLFRVSSSLDSLVVGEAQILGQVKDAFDLATAQGTLGPLLGRAIEWAFHVAKRVRSETQVGAGAVSVSSVAVELAKQIFGGLNRRVVTLIGAGTMGEAAARHLCDAGARLVVVNRSLERAQIVAEHFHGSARQWNQLQDALLETDVVIASTGSQDYLLTPQWLAPIQRKRKGRSLFVIDIAVPRNVDPRSNQIDGVYLYDIDDLSKMAATTLRDRFKEAQISERIVAEEADAFYVWQDSLQVTPTIVALRNQIRAVLDAELDKSLHGKLKHLGEAERKALEGMLSAAVKKLTHQPTIRLKSAAAEGNARTLVDAIQELFGIDPHEIPASSRSPSLPPTAHSDTAPISRSLEYRDAHPEEAS